MDKTLKILHLSDLHLDKDHLRDQRVVLKALFQDISETVSQQGPYSLVFFTGDLVAKGGYSDENKSAVVSEFIVPLLSAAQIEPDRLFLIPGNHDVNLKSQAGLIASAQKSIRCDDDAAAYLKDAISPGLNNGLEGFNDILKKLDGGDPVLSNTHYRAYLLDIEGLKVGIGAMNSAWHATGAPSDGDYGKLLVSRMQMDEVVAALNEADLKLALLHHPLSWLTPKDAQNTHRQILVNFDGLFHGHNHESDAIVSTGASSTYFVSNAGCLYQNRDYFNGYCSINYSHRNKRWVVRAREYYEARQVFDKAIRFNTDGVAEFIQTREVNPHSAPPSPSDEYIDSVQTNFNSRLLPSLVSEVAPHSLKSIFVAPPLSRVSQRKIDGSGKNGKSGMFVPLKDLLQSKKHVMFLGAKDMGKTTLLHHVCSLSLQFGSEMPPFGGYIDLEIAGETVPSLVDAVISFCGGAYRKSEIIALLQAGEFCICFDNLDERRAKQLKSVREFCSLFRKCRYYFSMLEDLDYSLSTTEVPAVVEGGAEVIFMHPFGRKETRLLTHNWFGGSVEECGEKVDEVLSLLGRLNIHRSPFLISALLWIRERQTQFTPVNQAEILDALIDGVMEKLSETKDRSKNDSTIKRHYLAALAEHLYSTGKKKIPTLELEAFTVKYFSSKGLPTSTGPFLAELKAKRILLEVGNEVTFMFEAIRAFFLSTRLHENPELLAKALSREHFLELAEELDYYTGRHRDRPQVLKRALELVAELCNETNIKHELSEFDNIRIGDAPVGAPIASRIAPVPSVRPSIAERHELLDSYDERSNGKATSSAEVVRATRGQSGIARYLETLRVGSAILRNSELVGDLALKEEGYDKLINGWCQVLIQVVHAIDTEAKGGTGNSVDDPVLHLLQGLLPTDNPGMARHLKKLVIPNVIMSFALEAIGTSKLQLVMEKHLGHSHTTVQRVLDVFLIVDLRFPKWLNHLDGLLKTYPKNRFVHELVFAKLFQIYMLGRLHVNEEERIRSLLGETIALMTPGGKGKDRTQRKGNFLRDLEKRKLIRYQK